MRTCTRLLVSLSMAMAVFNTAWIHSFQVFAPGYPSSGGLAAVDAVFLAILVTIFFSRWYPLDLDYGDEFKDGAALAFGGVAGALAGDLGYLWYNGWRIPPDGYGFLPMAAMNCVLVFCLGWAATVGWDCLVAGLGKMEEKRTAGGTVLFPHIRLVALISALLTGMALEHFVLNSEWLYRKCRADTPARKAE